MVITLDGPAGSGKSTVARLLAARLGFEYLDTGALYRAATLRAAELGIPWEDKDRLAELVRSARFDFRAGSGGSPGRVLIDERDVSGLIRTPELTGNIHHLADAPAVRREMNEHQRALARGRNLVADGRDLGTVVFPEAELKIYLDASADTRVRRRRDELQAGGRERTEQEVAEDLRQRDARDQQRAVAPLRCADDAVRVDTTHRTIAEVVDLLAGLVEQRRNQGA